MYITYTLFINILLQYYFSVGEARLLVPENVKSEYSRNGDLKIGYLTAIHSRSWRGNGMCRFSRAVRLRAVKIAIAVSWTIEKINKMPDFLPNITLGFTVMDTCSSVVDLCNISKVT